MKTWDECMSGGGLDGYQNYMGETDHKDMLVAPVGRSRDTECAIALSNFYVFLEALGGESETVQVHSFNHWGCGWFEIILIDPADKEAVRLAEDMEAGLSDYPVLDDQAMRNIEMEQQEKSWDNWLRGELIDFLPDDEPPSCLTITDEEDWWNFCQKSGLPTVREFADDELDDDAFHIIFDEVADECDEYWCSESDGSQYFDVDRIKEKFVERVEALWMETFQKYLVSVQFIPVPLDPGQLSFALVA